MKKLKILYTTPEGGKIVWISRDQKYCIRYGEGIWLSGFHLYKNINNGIWENVNYGTVYNSLRNAIKAIPKTNT